MHNTATPNILQKLRMVAEHTASVAEAHNDIIKVVKMSPVFLLEILWNVRSGDTTIPEAIYEINKFDSA